MKALTVLTLIQALTVNAAPHRKRNSCPSRASVLANTTTVAVVQSEATSPQLSAGAETDTSTFLTLHMTLPQSLSASGETSSSQVAAAVSQQPTAAESSPSTTTVLATISQPSAATESDTPTSQDVVTSPQSSTETDAIVSPTPASPTGLPQSSSANLDPTQRTIVDVITDIVTDTLTSTASGSGGIFFASVSTSTVIPSVSVTTVSTSSGTAQVLPSTLGVTPGTVGIIATSTNNTGAPTSAPILSTSIVAPSSQLSASAAATAPTTTVSAGMTSSNIFQPVETDAPPSVIGTRSDHPVARLGIEPNTSPIGTNKFYANFFLGSQTSASWTHPYSVAWSKGGGSSSSWGLAISHIDANQRVYGPDASANPVSYFVNPTGIQSIVLSASELGASTTLTTSNITAFSINVNLLPSAGAEPAITFPLVQGMGFVTAMYSGGTPIIQSGVFFQSITKATTNPKSGITKYTIILLDGKTWLLYVYSPDGTPLEFTLVSNGLIQATSNFNGVIQIAKAPNTAAQPIFDAASGAWPTTVALSGSVSDNTGSYTLSFEKAGLTNTTLAMFALPHHVESFSSVTEAALTTVQLFTTTKGNATAVVADSWTLIESLPTTLGFAPWSPSLGSVHTLSSAAKDAIRTVATSEVSQNMSEQTNLNSMYYSGKALAKFAGIVYTLHDLTDDAALARAGLTNLKNAFAVFTSNQQIYPLTYESAWGGVVSDASYVTGDSGADFGNTYYNDHHFHWGYFIYTAAVIGYLDPSWLAANQAWVNTLVRDIANPSTQDNYFPVYRMFDWYHGHSWAHGLYETSDGKDQESSSEDSMSAYALKMWGHTIGDSNMEARGNLQLAITARSLQNYFLYDSNNTVQPSNFIGNKVSGILFENKIDHTTYFGTNIEYIQGIHMLPLLPSSTLTRTTTFVQQEWDTWFSNGRADVDGGWRGVLYSNYAIINPTASWSFFSQSGFDVSWLDGGASRTWYMALAAGLGGAPS